MDFLLDDDNAWILMVMALGVFLVWHYSAHIRAPRFWMWAAGLVGVALMVWMKGADEIWTWLLAAGWAAVLVYCDRRFMGAESEG